MTKKENKKVTCPNCKKRTRNLDRHRLECTNVIVKIKSKPRVTCDICQRKTKNLDKHKFIFHSDEIKLREFNSKNKICFVEPEKKSSSKKETNSVLKPYKPRENINYSPAVPLPPDCIVVNVCCRYCGEHIPVVLNGTPMPNIPDYAVRVSSYLFHKECFSAYTRE